MAQSSFGSSPSPKVIDESKTLGFPGAIKKIISGKKVTKLEWKNREFYGHLSEGQLMLHKPDGEDHPWLVSDGDMLGEDWVEM